MHFQVAGLVICAVLSAAMAEVYFEEKFKDGTYLTYIANEWIGLLLLNKKIVDVGKNQSNSWVQLKPTNKYRCDTIMVMKKAHGFITHKTAEQQRWKLIQKNDFFSFVFVFPQAIGKRIGCTAKRRAKNSVNLNWPLVNSSMMLKPIKVRVIFSLFISNKFGSFGNDCSIWTWHRKNHALLFDSLCELCLRFLIISSFFRTDDDGNGMSVCECV